MSSYHNLKLQVLYRNISVIQEKDVWKNLRVERKQARYILTRAIQFLISTAFFIWAFYETFFLD